MTEDELASDVFQLLTRGFIEIDGVPVDDASPRLRPTAAGVAVLAEQDDAEREDPDTEPA